LSLGRSCAISSQFNADPSVVLDTLIYLLLNLNKRCSRTSPSTQTIESCPPSFEMLDSSVIFALAHIVIAILNCHSTVSFVSYHSTYLINRPTNQPTPSLHPVSTYQHLLHQLIVA